MEQEINGKVQKINDEDFELINIIEAKTYIDAIKWYQEKRNIDADGICGADTWYCLFN